MLRSVAARLSTRNNTSFSTAHAQLTRIRAAGIDKFAQGGYTQLHLVSVSTKAYIGHAESGHLTPQTPPINALEDKR